MNHNNILTHYTSIPWIIEESKLYEIMEFGEKIIAGSLSKDYPEYEQAGVRVVGSTAIVPIYGTITQKVNMFSRISGGTSTHILETAIKQIEQDQSIKSVVLDIDSPGGTVPGTANVAAALRRLREKKKVIAVANESMCSGAYWIGSAASTIYLGSPTAEIGSIGVYMVAKDTTKQQNEMGVKLHLVKRGEYKGLAADGKIDDEVLSELQRRIDSTYKQFVKEISLNRNITMDEAEKMANGQVLQGDEAVDAGLADGIKTLDEVLAELNEVDELKSFIRVKEIELQNVTAERDEVTKALLEKQGELDHFINEVESLKSKIQRQEAEMLVDEFATKIPAQMKEQWVERCMTLGVAEVRGILESLNDVVEIGESNVDTRTEVENEDLPVAHSLDEAKIFEAYKINYIKKF